MTVKIFVYVCFNLLVQVSSERGWDCGCLQIPVSHAGWQSGSEAGLTILWTFLYGTKALETLCSDQKEPWGFAGES